MTPRRKRRIEFPKTFLWGSATSAYQIEGSPLADGAGPSIWQRFAHTPGLVRDGDTGDVACDHYRRYADDVALMRALGLQAYRFSIVVESRAARGHAARSTQRGSDFYERLVDTLLAHGIAPLVTLYHWDLPAALDDRGGWLNPDIADWFADYAQRAVRKLDDRVKIWATLNEPWVVTDGGYLHGALAPGHRNRFEAPIAAHNLLRAHGAGGAGVSRGREAPDRHRREPRAEVSGVRTAPKTSPRPRARDAYMNRQYLDPVFLGRYPNGTRGDLRRSVAALAGRRLGADQAADRFRRHQLLHAQRHALRSSVVAATRGRRAPDACDVHRDGLGSVPAGPDRHARVGQANATAIRRSTSPRTARRSSIRRSPKAIVLSDPLRVDYLPQAPPRRPCRDRRRACDVRGYFAWSLLDNFEWSLGFSKRFGIVHVDFETQKRTPKDSAHFYARVIASRGSALNEPD